MVKPTSKEIRFLLIWITFHAFALISHLLSKFLRNESYDKENDFWPMSQYIDTYSNPVGSRYEHLPPAKTFNGIFAGYDLSEFLVYTIGALLIYLIYKFTDR